MRLWRIYFQGGNPPVSWNTFRFFGPTSSRFDHHLPPRSTQDRGMLYLALDGETPFVEVFREGRTIDRRRGSPWLVAFDLDTPLALLDLGGPWPTRAGASAAVNSGSRPRARRWSQRIYEAYPRVEGLWYSSSMDGNRPSVALYERAVQALPKRPVYHRSLADPALTGVLLRMAAKFGYRVVG
jgi:RES domain-containing protein